MIDIKKAQEQIREQRQLLESQRKSIKEEEFGIEQAKIHLTKEQKKLPRPTQRLLRSGMFAGLEGRKRRRKVSEIKKEIEQRKKGLFGREKELGEVKKELTKFEKEQLIPFEKSVENISKYDDEIRKAEKKLDKYRKWYDEQRKRRLDSEYKRDIEHRFERKSAYYRGLIEKLKSYKEAGYDFNAGLDSAMEYADYLEEKEEAYQQQRIFERQYKEEIKQKAKLQGVSIPSLKIEPIYDKSGKLIGVSDPFKQMSRLPTPAERLVFGNKKTFKIEPQKKSIPSFTSSRDLPRTDFVKDFKPMKSIDLTKTVFRPSDTFKIPVFRTTGSPIRITKLTSPKSRGYISSIPIRKSIKTKISYPTKIKSKPKKIKKSIFDSDKDFLFKKKKSNKKNKFFWGI